MRLSFAKHTPTGPRPEDTLLLQCARMDIGAEDTQRIKDLLHEGVDWTYVIQTALLHGVMPLLYRNLSSIYSKAVPKAVLDQLQDHFRGNARYSLLATGQLFKLLDLLKCHQIPVIPYKGPVLATAIYGNLALRQFSDLDLLVHKHDYLRAQDLLIAQGYQLIGKYGWESSFMDANTQVCVDLHRAITPQAFPLPLEFERLWQRLESIVIAGITVPNLSLEDMLIILCVQVAKDRWEDRIVLGKICDIAELLGAHQGMDWKGVMEEAIQLRSQRMLLFSLGLTNDLLGTALPQEVWRRIQADSSISLLLTHARRRLFHETEGNSLDLLRRIRFHFEIQQRWRDKLAQLRMVQVKLHEWRSARH